MNNTNRFQNMNQGPQNAFDIHQYGTSISALYELKSPYALIKERFDYNDNLFLSSAEAPLYFYSSTDPLNDSTFNYSQTHQHDYFEIMFVMDGNTVQKIENQKYLYHTGQCCLLNHAVRHREQPCGNSSLYFLMLSDDFVTRMIQNDLCFNTDGSHQLRSNTVYEFFRRSLKSRDKQYMDFYPKVTSERIIPLLDNLFLKLSRENARLSYGSYPVIQGIISEIFGILLDYSLYTSRRISVDNSKQEALFIQIQRLLESHSGKISRQEIAETLHYSDSYLNKIVKQSVGMSLLEYRKFFTIKEAAHLLGNTDKTISEIIDELGFSGRTYFNNLFKKQYGITPSQYRKNIRKDS